MLKRKLLLFLFLFQVGSAWAADPYASRVKSSTTNFNNNLSASHDTVQKVLDFLDDVSIGDVTAVGDCTGAACFDGTSGTTLTFNNAGGDMTLAYDGSRLTSSKPMTVTGNASAGTGNDLIISESSTNDLTEAVVDSAGSAALSSDRGGTSLGRTAYTYYKTAGTVQFATGLSNASDIYYLLDESGNTQFSFTDSGSTTTGLINGVLTVTAATSGTALTTGTQISGGSSTPIIDFNNFATRRFALDAYGQIYVGDITSTNFPTIGSSLAALNFANNTGDKQYLYNGSNASRWGFGIQSWAFCMFMDAGNPGTGRFSWRNTPNSSAAASTGDEVMNLYTTGTMEQILNTTTAKGHTIKLAASATGKAFEVQNSSGTVLSSIDASGLHLAPAGSQSTPSYQVGQTNTGLYLYTTNQPALVGGGGNTGLICSSGNSLTMGIQWVGGTSVFKLIDAGVGTLNRTGSNLAIKAGEGTGNGTPGNVSIHASGVLGSGTTLQTNYPVATFSSDNASVNQFYFNNAATGTNPELLVSGTDSNVGLDLQGKGTGSYNFLSTSSAASQIRLYEDTDDGSNYTSFAPVAMAANVVYTLPPDDGDAGEQLQTNGSGVLTWEAAGGAGATAWDDIGDADGTGSISFAGFDQDIDSAEDGGDILTITNSDADRAADSVILKLADNDGADANAIYLQMIGDADGSPTTDFYVSQTSILSGTQTIDFGGATALEMPNGSAPAVSVDGQFALETDQDQIKIQAGSNGTGGIPSNTDVVLPLLKQVSITLPEPDLLQGVSDAWPIFCVDSYNFPNGIQIVAIRLATSASSSASYNIEEWVSPVDGAPTTIDAIATSTSNETTETTISDGAVATGGYVFVDLDTTDIAWAEITLWFYVKDA